MSGVESDLDTATSKIDAMEANYIPNPNVSILFFFIITTNYFILKLVTLPDNYKKSTGSTNIVWLSIYILLLVAGNYFINLSTTNAMCGGTPQWGTSFIVTIVPYLLIFGVINIILILFPGWLTPFSNTIGYLAANLGGLTELFNDKILNVQLKDNLEQGSDNDIQVGKALQHIYGNKSLLINEIPREGDSEDQKRESFEKFYSAMERNEIFKKQDNDGDENRIKTQLYNLLTLKDIVAEYVWNLLTGLLVTSVSYNYRVNVGCDYSAKQMKNSYKEYINKEKTIPLTD